MYLLFLHCYLFKKEFFKNLKKYLIVMLLFQPSVLVSQDCCDGATNTQWLQTTETCWPLGLEVRNLKPGGGQGRVLSKGSRGRSFLLSQLQVFANNPWPFLARGCVTPVTGPSSPSVSSHCLLFVLIRSACKRLLFTRTQSDWIRAHHENLILSRLPW